MNYLPIDLLKQFMIEVFVKIGVPHDDAVICSNVLIASDLRGIESHGIGRLKMYYDRIKLGIQNPVTRIDVIRDKYATAVWDGNHGMGHVIAHKAMQTAIEKAGKYGLGSVAVRNSTHYGICGYYADMATKHDMIGITFTNARPSICPTHGVDPLLGTNPVCFGAPSNLEFPFIYDAATSISQRGKIEQLDREEKQTPTGWAINKQGESCTDTKQLLKDLVSQTAAMLPIGGIDELTGSHKGYGLATMVEILSAALQDGSYTNALLGQDSEGKPAPYKLGHFFLAINIDFFTDLERFKEIVGDICTQLQSSTKLPGQDRIWVAGEKEYENEQRVRRQGVPVVPNLQKNIEFMQNALGIELIRF
ncbi:MAG TPA: Ldh family oxidoreductase [Candidatus Cloacimonadota bacterium]|nr:Ldh family oxidoreductase [Candidatus Cloacimonadota bacterium]HPS38741.1 Ldh family oxidoreductase [Candidatus Cloacimonadota bacterium]